MSRRAGIAAFVAAAVLALLAGGAQAQQYLADEGDFEFTSYSDIEAAFAAQQREIESLRAELASLGSAAGTGCGTSSCCQGCVDPSCCRTCGVIGGAELTLFDVYANHGVGGTGADWFEEFDMEVDGRFWVGYQGANGFGVLGRYWQHDVDNPDGLNEYFSVRLYDVEATFDVRFCRWDFLAAAGVRWGDIAWSDENGSPGYGFDGVGPTLAVRARRQMIGNIYVVGGVRYSALFGETTEVASPDDYANGIAVHALEARLGVEWRRDLAIGGSLVLGALWEHQLYSSLSGNVDSDIDPEDVDITLAGPVFSIAFER